MDWCVQFSGFLGMSAHNPYILPPCRIVKTGTRFFWSPANQRARQKTVQRKPLWKRRGLTPQPRFPILQPTGQTHRSAPTLPIP